jgi:cytochrome oxidase assembly protein ShyY1
MKHLLTRRTLSARRGRYDGARQFLVDNHTRRGAGYLVVTLFETMAATAAVDRGYRRRPRATIVDAPTPDTWQGIVGVLWAASSATTDRGAWSDGWPKRVEQFDGERMSETLGGAIPMEFRLEEGEPGGLEPIVLGEEMSSNRHTGYAVQWFAIATALVVAFGGLGLRRAREV